MLKVTLIYFSRFKNLEKSIKSFLQNSDGFGNRYRDVLGMEYLLLQHMADLWASDHTSFIDSYCVAMKRVSQLYRQFVSDFASVTGSCDFCH